MAIVTHIADALTTLFTKADELALTTGFIKRQRKITGSNFLKTLLFAWMPKAAPSVESIARTGFTHHLHISAQGIEQRLTKSAGDFLKTVIGHIVTEKIKADDPVNIEILGRFTVVYATDGSKITLPNEFKEQYPGTGGTNGSNQAALKMDVCIELRSGKIECGILSGRDSDNHSPIAEKSYEKGALHLRDLGYFNLPRMKQQSERGEYWISRLFPNTKIYTTNCQYIDLEDYLFNLPQTQCLFDIDVLVGKTEQVKSRLVIARLPQAAASKRRAKLKENARKHGRTPTARNLALCDWGLYISNVEREKLTTKECLQLYRVRWQIELLFKLWKTHNQIDQSRSKKHGRILCEIYIKLLVVLIQHWILLTGLWDIPQRSLVKGTQLIKEQTARFAEAVEDKSKLIMFLLDMSKRFKHGCSLNKRRTNPNTVDQLLACLPFS